MNIINTKDVPTRLASPYSAKYRHRRPLGYPRTEAPIGAHPQRFSRLESDETGVLYLLWINVRTGLGKISCSHHYLGTQLWKKECTSNIKYSASIEILVWSQSLMYLS